MKEGQTEHLVVFTRFPQPGTTKTRLTGKLGIHGAANLQKDMTEHVLIQVNKLSLKRQATFEIRFEGGDTKKLIQWLGPDYAYHPQGQGNIGQRMHRAIKNAFKSGMTSVVVIGTDVPDISSSILEKAFLALSKDPLVIGPANDGGYYLIGLNQSLSPEVSSLLFYGIEWGSDRVFHQTIDVIHQSGLRYTVLDILNDVDRPEDIPVWRKTVNNNRYGLTPKKISIVIPTLNEAEQLPETIQSVKNGSQSEIIVADGGSTDKTLDLAASMGARIIKSSPPKSSQLNTGAGHATGDVLLFLHADTRLPNNYQNLVLNCLRETTVGAGAFELGIGSPARKLRAVEKVANFRSRVLKQPYGDQAIFIPSKIFFKLGGFPNIPIMEDFELIRRIRKKWKIVTLPARVTTSPRRWNNLGVVKTTIINQMVVAAYFVGVPINIIARIYRRNRGLEVKT